MHDIDDFDDDTFVSYTGTTSQSEQVTTTCEAEVIIKHFRHKCATGRFTHLTDDEKAHDCYGLLKIPRNANSLAVKEAYHQQCLETHPDKQGVENDEAFKKVVKAFGILGDPLKRRVYDSIGPIDELVLKDKEYTDEEFFEAFEKYFQKFSKWCHVQPPSLGDINTNMDLVDEFYDFWFDFKSWRDFSFHIDEEIPAEISREEKRYIYHDCERKIGKLMRNESKSVRTLVDKCRKSDPRIKRRTQQKQDERNERILERKLAAAKLDTRNQKTSSASTKPDVTHKKKEKACDESQPAHPATWGDLDIIELQKAIVMFPRGTVDRWTKMSTFLKEKYSAADVLAKTKEMENQWKVAKDHSQKNNKLDVSANASTTEQESASPSGWSLKQQKQLEGQLRKYSTYKEQDKWIKISQSVDGKSDKECIERYKSLCKMFKR